MKRVSLFFLGLFICVYSQNLFAQGAPDPIVGVKGGFNFSNIAGDTDNALKTSAHLGVYAEVFFDYFLMLQAEFLFSQQGHGALDDFSNSLNLNYISIPVMARYNLGYNVNVHAGIQFGIMLSAKSNFQGDKFTVSDQFKPLDIGIPIGVGYEFADRKFNVTARYTLGVSNVADSGIGSRKNRVGQISVGMLLFRVSE